MQILTHFSNVPLEALPLLAEQLRALGAPVVFESQHAGYVRHPLGTIKFDHTGERLFIYSVTNFGALSRRLLAGRIRTALEESLQKLAYLTHTPAS